MDDRLLPLLQTQRGVVSRRQALLAGLTRENIDRLCRRRELARLFPRVYVDHTGPASWEQRAWGAVLWGWPAVLSHGSALGAVEGPASSHRTEPLHIAVTRERRLVRVAGIVVHRSEHVRARSQSGSPPRTRYDEAALDVLSALTEEDDVVAELGRILNTRRTTPTRLASTLGGRAWLPHRAVLDDILEDAVSGATSALERSFLWRVERAHGLPGARRQERDVTVVGTAYRDALYELGTSLLAVELDGRRFHDTARQRDRDLDRDLVTLLHHTTETVRLGWGQCRGRPCRTAGFLGAVLVRRGWTGEVQACRPGCEAPAVLRRALIASAA